MLEKFLPFIGKIVKTITLNKVIVWGVTASILVVGYTIFEQRKVLYNFIFEDAPAVVALKSTSFTVSEQTKTAVKTLVVGEDNIAAIIILSADIRNNYRNTIFWFSDDSSIQRSLDALYLNRNAKIPLFSSDQKNNEEIVSVINGEFTCTKYDDAANKSIFPGLKDKFPFICRTSLPPYYGQFSGYIAFVLHSLPDTTALDKIKSEAISLATEIYFRDILTTGNARN